SLRCCFNYLPTNYIVLYRHGEGMHPCHRGGGTLRHRLPGKCLPGPADTALLLGVIAVRPLPGRCRRRVAAAAAAAITSGGAADGRAAPRQAPEAGQDQPAEAELGGVARARAQPDADGGDINQPRRVPDPEVPRELHAGRPQPQEEGEGEGRRG
ncbi:unnamed protein product, partial [Ectocarpus sp. 6 AP-2014]